MLRYFNPFSTFYVHILMKTTSTGCLHPLLYFPANRLIFKPVSKSNATENSFNMKKIWDF